jgi:DNA polymerase-3 subunit delta'
MPTIPEGITGHALQRALLQDDLATGNVAHAYLFAGPKHLGKWSVAQWFAKELLLYGAQNRTDRERIAAETDRLIHPDLLVLDELWIEDRNEDLEALGRATNIPQQHRVKSRAKTDTISIDDIRAMQERLFEVKAGQYRAALIRSAERMHEEAVNSLLKVLEEPPDGLVFILSSESPSALPPTLISRTRVLHFQPVPYAELTPLLSGLSDDDRRFLLRRAQGAPGIIIRLKADPDLLRQERLAYSNALAFWEATTLRERLKLLEPLNEKTEESEHFLLHLALALREKVDSVPTEHVEALNQLIGRMQTNVQRPLLTEEFALALT